jgi:hypothetical protein
MYEGDPLSPPEGEAAQGGRPLDPRENYSVETTFLPSEAPTRRPSDPRRGGLAHRIEYFYGMIPGQDFDILPGS